VAENIQILKKRNKKSIYLHSLQNLFISDSL